MDQSKYLHSEQVPPPGIKAVDMESPDGRHKVEIQPKANIPILEMDTFYEFLAQADKPVLVDFWAPWVSHCTHMIPIYEELAAEDHGFYVAKVNVDTCKPLVSRYSIMVVPTAILFKDGKPVASNTGAMTKEDILTGVKPFL
ncbi:MAG: thioredoxin family protein [Coriobacteriales bacterium]|jgi:thioredoxin 1